MENCPNQAEVYVKVGNAIDRAFVGGLINYADYLLANNVNSYAFTVGIGTQNEGVVQQSVLDNFGEQAHSL